MAFYFSRIKNVQDPFSLRLRFHCWLSQRSGQRLIERHFLKVEIYSFFFFFFFNCGQTWQISNGDSTDCAEGLSRTLLWILRISCKLNSIAYSQQIMSCTQVTHSTVVELYLYLGESFIILLKVEGKCNLRNWSLDWLYL